MKKIFTIMIYLALFSSCVSAEVFFTGADLYKQDEILFSAVSECPGHAGIDSYDTLFCGDLKTGFLRQLTFFPEDILYLPASGQIQINNRFGVFRSDISTKIMAPVVDFPGFINGIDIKNGKTERTAASPDGKFLLYMVPSSKTKADLILYDIGLSRESLISENIDYSYDISSFIWTSDSEVFLYSKNNKIYYYPVAAEKVLSEEERELGPGRPGNVTQSGGSVFYLRNSFIYRIAGRDLTEGRYFPLFQAEDAVGKIPFDFDSNFDKIFISPSGLDMIFMKGSRDLFVIRLDNDCDFAIEESRSLPHLFLPRNTYVKDLIWSKSDIVTIQTETILSGRSKSAVIRLDMNAASPSFDFIDTDGIKGTALSPDEKKIAIASDDAVAVKDYETWKDISRYYFPSPLKVIWKNDSELISAGACYTEVINTDSKTRSIVALSSADKFGYSPALSSFIALADGQKYVWDPAGFWSMAEDQSVGMRSASLSSDKFRIFYETVYSGSFRNLIMVKNLMTGKVSGLFKADYAKYAPLPDDEEEVIDIENFSHGSRKMGRKVSLVFNAVNSDEGLAEILTVLDRYKIKATFFISGDFMKNYPAAVREIAASGHETGSLFSYYFNLTDSRFSVSPGFIREGLRKNEEEYYKITGTELTRIWHAPYYFANSSIIRAAQEAGYTYVGRDIVFLDWKSRKDDFATEQLYIPSADLAEKCMDEKRPGSIIPITAGRPENLRDDYLFQYLDLIINDLIREGYSVIPVKSQIDMVK